MNFNTGKMKFICENTLEFTLKNTPENSVKTTLT